MKLHLVDGTYELFRQYYGRPKVQTAEGREVGAVRGMLRTIGSLLADDEVTHIAVAFDSVIESFRNDLFDGYKTGAGIDPALWSQQPIAMAAVRALGVTVWPMIDHETDDAIATAAHRFRDEVDQVVICSVDKDFAQCVRGDRVVILDRRREITYDEPGVLEKWGVPPASIPDLLALVGDAADGIPGIPRWGQKSTAAVLNHYGHLDAIPDDAADWTVTVRGAKGLASNLAERRQDARLFRTLATLVEDVPLKESLDDLEWRGAHKKTLTDLCEGIEFTRFVERIRRFV